MTSTPSPDNRAADLAEHREWVTQVSGKAQAAEIKGDTANAEFYHSQLNDALATERAIANGESYQYR